MRPLIEPLAARAKLTLVVCPLVMVTVLPKLVNPLADDVKSTLPTGRFARVKLPFTSVTVLAELEATFAPEIPAPSAVRVTRPVAVPVFGITIRLT